MDDVTLNGKVHPCIEVVEACGEWFVRVVEEDQELTRAFEIESFALATDCRNLRPLRNSAHAHDRPMVPLALNR